MLGVDTTAGEIISSILTKHADALLLLKVALVMLVKYRKAHANRLMTTNATLKGIYVNECGIDGESLDAVPLRNPCRVAI